MPSEQIAQLLKEVVAEIEMTAHRAAALKARRDLLCQAAEQASPIVAAVQQLPLDKLYLYGAAIEERIERLRREDGQPPYNARGGAYRHLVGLALTAWHDTHPAPKGADAEVVYRMMGDLGVTEKELFGLKEPEDDDGQT
jgi:hypothetical protein